MNWTFLKHNTRAYNIDKKNECFGVLEDTLAAHDGEGFAIIQVLDLSCLDYHFYL